MLIYNYFLFQYGVMLVLILVMELTAAGMAFANKSKVSTSLGWE